MIYIIDLPPPLHGMSYINAKLMELSEAHLGKQKVINTSPNTSFVPNFRVAKLLNKGVHLILCYLKLVSLLLLNYKGVVYRSVYGGYGQLFDIPFIILARIFQNKLYIHHHSYQYLNSKLFITSLLFNIAGKNAVHIVLSDSMGKELSKKYRIRPANIITVSNINFFADPSIDIVASNKLKLGHLANLSFEKGLDSFIELCEQLNNADIEFEAYLAGPINDSIVEAFVAEKLKTMPNLTYKGSLYGSDKDNFYRSIDCFVFLSRYQNEAEPLVLYEAAEKGNFLIGTERGCMGNTIKSLGGFVVDDNKQSLNLIVEFIIKNKTKLIDVTQKLGRLKQYNRIRLTSKANLVELIENIKKYEISKP